MAKRSFGERAGDKAKQVRTLGVRTARANAGMIDEIIDATIDRWIEGEDFDACLDAAQSDIADMALTRYGDKVRNALARLGVVLPDGEEITADAIIEAIQEKTGLDFGDFTTESVMAAVDGLIAKQISRYTGIDGITTVSGMDFTDAVKVGVRAALRSGTLNKLVGRLMDRRARKAATLRRLGATKYEYATLKNREYQAKYRERNVQKWI